MIWAAPWAAVLSLLAAGLMQFDIAHRPQDLGHLFAVTLLGSWSVLAANKVAEDREVESMTRRIIQLVVGIILGLIAYFLANWMLVEPATTGGTLVWFNPLNTSISQQSGALGYAAYFGLAGLAVDWWTLTDRARKSRFRLVPMAKAAILAAIPGVLFFSPEQHPFAIPAVVLTSAVVQLTSPWSEAAARYAAYVRATAGKKAKVA
jgi:hypothetical protein